MPTARSPHLKASIAADAMTPLMPGAGPPPTRIASVSATFGPHAIDHAGIVVADEERSLRADRDAGRAPVAAGTSALKTRYEIAPLRCGILPVDRRRGPVAVHRDENHARWFRIAAVGAPMPRAVRGDEESALIRGRKRVAALM